MKFCPQCGTKLESDMRFCVVCGARQPEMNAEVETPIAPARQAEPITTPTEAVPVAVETEAHETPVCKKLAWNRVKGANWGKISGIIRASVIMLAALLMLLTAFLPIFTVSPSGVSARASDMDEVELKISAAQNIVFLFDTLQQLDEEELEDSELADELYELQEELFEQMEADDADDFSDLSDEGMAVFAEYILVGLRLGMQSENTATPYSLIALGVLSAAYIVLAVLAFLFALLHLLSACGVMKRLHFTRTVLSFAVLVPMLLFALQSAMTVFYAEPTAFSLSMTGLSVWTVVLGGLVLASFVLTAALKKQLPTVPQMLKRLPAMAMAIALLCTLSGSVVNTNVKTEFANKSRKSEATMALPAGFFNNLVLSENDYEEYSKWVAETPEEEMNEYFEEYFEDFSWYSKRQFERGDAYDENIHLLIEMGAPFDFHLVMPVFGIIPVLYILAAVAAALILWQNLVFLAGGKYRRWSVILSKILALVAMLGALALAIVYVVMNNLIYIAEFIPKGYSLSVGAGVIAATALALAAVFCPSRARSRNEH